MQRSKAYLARIEANCTDLAWRVLQNELQRAKDEKKRRKITLDKKKLKA